MKHLSVPKVGHRFGKKKLFNSDVYWVQSKIAAAFYCVPFILFKGDFFCHTMCNVPDYIFFSCFNISKDYICVAIAAYFYSSPKRLYLLCLHCTFAI